MSNELERRLEGLFAEAPEPDPGAGEEALQRSLHALRPAAPAHRGLRTAVVVFATALVLLAIAAGSLAAAGSLHVSFHAKPKPHGPAAPRTLALPPGAAGVAAVVNGRLSVVTQSGFRLQGLPVTAAALSPQALYVAAGINGSLVAMAPNGALAWSHPAGGRVVEIAWAPDGLQIAYVVHAGHRYVLHVVYGNGKHDTTLDRSVRAVQPSWRADSLAFAYVGAGGRAIVYDLGHRKRSVVGPTAPITRLAFAPSSDVLAAATPDSVLVGGRRFPTGRIEALGWARGVPVAAVESARQAAIRIVRGGRPVDSFVVPGRVIGFTGGLVVTRTEDRLLAWLLARSKSVTTLLGLAHPSSVDDVAIR
ncbi:MAG TPA: hypothetical protein VFU30_12230 [Gaiellaceae bacterium]|nr:hypothetical protein [Gaiellaceae bacterium]